MRNNTDYDFVVIGGGAAGLSAAGYAVAFGAKTLLVERDRLGGDCTWTGCVPSKTLLNAAAAWKNACDQRGPAGPSENDEAFARAMNRVRQTRQRVYRHADTPERFEGMGVDVQFGNVRFVDPHSIEIDGPGGGRIVRSRYIIVATGSVPIVPGIPGIQNIEYMTNETLFELEERPGTMAVIGAGPVGIELAQAFSRFGTGVTVLEREDSILPREDRELSYQLERILSREGIGIRTGANIRAINADDAGIALELNEDQSPVRVDRLLIAAGRESNVSPLSPGNAGLSVDHHRIRIDASCRTRVKHIYAVGDVATEARFTHAAGRMAKVAVQHALFRLPDKFLPADIPRLVYTDPELGQIGTISDEQDDKIESYRMPVSSIDRAATEQRSDGHVVIRADRRGRIVSASVLAPHAGELVGTISAARRKGLSLRDLSDTIFPYPTYTESLGRIGAKFMVRSVPDWLLHLGKILRRLRGSGVGLDEKNLE